MKLFLYIALIIIPVQLKAGDDYLRKPKNGNTYVIAHRGAHKGIPENSLPAYQKAIDLGCDFIEIDVRKTRDGHIVSVHDASIDAYVNGITGKVSDFTLAELKELDIGERMGPEWKNTRIPTIEEILQLCRGKIGIYLDLKEDLVDELAAIITEYEMERDVVWYIPAFRMDAIKKVKSLCPHCVPMPDPGPSENIAKLVKQVQALVIATDMGHLNEAYVEIAHGYQTKVFVDEDQGGEAEWTRILDWGTDGIQTDHPRELIRFLSERGKEISLRLKPQQGNPRNSEGDFIQLEDGRILFIYTHFTGGTGDHASAYLAGRYSNDGGKTWTKEDVVILPNEGSMNVMSVSLLRLISGEIALFYLRKNSESDCIPFMRISTDEASTWSEAIRCMDAEGYHVVNNDRLVQLQNGRIIYPTALHNRVNSRMEAAGQIMCYYSDDMGKSWIKSEQVPNPDNVVMQEPGIIELKNGSLMLFCRTDAGVQYFSFSENQGLTWLPVEPGNIKSPLSPASIERIPATGDLLLAWNNNYEPGRDGGKRTPFNMAVSKDEGKSWQFIKTIESDPAGWYCYTAIEFVGNHVLLGHCAGDTRTNNGLSTTQITRLSLDWIYQQATSDPFVASDSSGRVELSSKDKSAQIRYTLDGSLPTQSTGILYEQAFRVDRTRTLYMQAFKTGQAASQIVSAHIGRDVYQKALQHPIQTVPGLIYHYYEGEFHASGNIEENHLTESGVIPQFTIGGSHLNSNFAFIFEGYIHIPEDGPYTFYLESNDGSIMYLDDHLLIDNDEPHGAYERSVSTSLKAGLHKIAVRYFQLGGGSLLRVRWEGPDFPKQEIGAEFLFHETGKTTGKK